MTTEESIRRLTALRKRLHKNGATSYYSKAIFIALLPLPKPDGHISPLKFRSILDEHFESVGAIPQRDGTTLRVVHLGDRRDLDKHIAAVVQRQPRWWQDLCLGLRDIRLLSTTEKVTRGAPTWARRASFTLISRLTDMSVNQRRASFLAYLARYNLPVDRITFEPALLEDRVTLEPAPIYKIARFNAVFNCTGWEEEIPAPASRPRAGQLQLALS